MPRRGFHGRSRAARKPTLWSSTEITPGNGGALLASLSVTQATGTAPATFFTRVQEPLDYTVLRTRGVWNVSISNVLKDELIMVSVGIGVVSEQAAAAAGVPEVITNADWDGWMYHSSVVYAGRDGDFNGIASVVNPTELDVKAMRKVETGNTQIIVAQVQNLTGTLAQPIVSLGIFLRQLERVN